MSVKAERILIVLLFNSTPSASCFLIPKVLSAESSMERAWVLLSDMYRTTHLKYHARAIGVLQHWCILLSLKRTEGIWMIGHVILCTKLTFGTGLNMESHYCIDDPWSPRVYTVALPVVARVSRTFTDGKARPTSTRSAWPKNWTLPRVLLHLPAILNGRTLW